MECTSLCIAQLTTVPVSRNVICNNFEFYSTIILQYSNRRHSQDPLDAPSGLFEKK